MDEMEGKVGAGELLDGGTGGLFREPEGGLLGGAGGFNLLFQSRKS